MEFRASPAKSVGLLFLVFLMGAGAYYLTTLDEPEHAAVIGWMGVVFCGISAIFTFRGLFVSGVQVTIDERGILDHRLGVGCIPWEDVAEFRVSEVQSQKFLSFRLVNEARYIASMPFCRRMLSKLNRATGFSAFCIGFQELTPGIDEAEACVREHLARIEDA